jgi:uncharacterized protein YacL
MAAPGNGDPTQATNMAIWILRCAFLLVAAGVGAALVSSDVFRNAPWAPAPFVVVMLGALVLVAIDALIPRKRIDLIASLYLGVVVGLILSYLVMLAIAPMIESAVNDLVLAAKIQGMVHLLVSIGLCYLCVSLLMQTKDDFRFIIPYIEFAKEVKGLKPYILDTSVVIDGRIADVVETGVLDNQLIMPRFVLQELQSIADSNDKLRRARGRRGLDVLNRLRGDTNVDLKIEDLELPEMAGQPVDTKLVLLAKHLDGKIVTGDYNLNKVARLHNVAVINLNDISNSLKPVFLPGEEVDVRILKPGEAEGQGVGYLDDGTMVVIEGGRDHIHETVRIAVTSVLQTSAGRMVFGRIGGANSAQPEKSASSAARQRG